MFRTLVELIRMLLSFRFLYLIAIGIMILGIVYTIQTNQNSSIKEEPPQKSYSDSPTKQKVIKPRSPFKQLLRPAKKLVLVEVCKKIQGCRTIDGVCEGCVLEKKWVTE